MLDCFQHNHTFQAVFRLAKRSLFTDKSENKNNVESIRCHAEACRAAEDLYLYLTEGTECYITFYTHTLTYCITTKPPTD